MSQLRQQQKRLEALGAAVLVVTFEGRQAARAYVEETGLGWPLLIDASRSLYQAYGMGRGRLRDIWGPASWRAYARAIRHRHWPRLPAGDPNQLGGDVLIDPDGIVRLHQVGTGPADRPPVDGLLAIVQGAG